MCVGSGEDGGEGEGGREGEGGKVRGGEGGLCGGVEERRGGLSLSSRHK